MYKQVTSKGDNGGTSFSCEAKTSSCKSEISKAFKTLDTMVVLGKCCCCDLKTGVIVLGVFNLVFSVIGAILCSWVLVLLAATTIAATQSDDLKIAIQEELSSIIEEEYKKVNTDWDFSKLILDMGIKMGVCVELLFIFFIIGSSLLIHGARKGKPYLLYPYMFVGCLRIAFYVHSFIRYCFAIGEFPIGIFYGMLFVLTIEIFFLHCVSSLSQEQKRDMKQELGGLGLQKMKGPLVV